MTAHWNYWGTLYYQLFDSINKNVMGKYNPDNCYEKEQAINAQRKDFVCPCCEKNFLLSEARLEKFELSREYVLHPSPGYLIRFGGYRICEKCHRRRSWTTMLPITIIKYSALLAILPTVIAFIIDADKYGFTVLGLWMIIATPLTILSFVIPYTLFHKYTKSFDFDKNLSNNAVDWFPLFTDNK